MSYMQLARCVALLRRTEIDARNPVFIPLFLRFQALRVAMHQPCEIKLTLLDFVGLILQPQAGVGLGIIPGTLYDLRGPVGACLYGRLSSLAYTEL